MGDVMNEHLFLFANDNLDGHLDGRSCLTVESDDCNFGVGGWHFCKAWWAFQLLAKAYDKEDWVFQKVWGTQLCSEQALKW